MIFVLLGKSASGKDTLLNAIHLDKCISTTSRPIRENEVQGVDYFFVTKDEFIEKIKNNKFIEYRKYSTKFNNENNVWYYGTEKNNIDISKNTVLVLDLNGFKEVKEYFKDEIVIGIYLHCPTELRTIRAKMRGSYCALEWKRRLKADKEDFENVYDYVDYVLNSSVSTDELLIEFNKILQIYTTNAAKAINATIE